MRRTTVWVAIAGALVACGGGDGAPPAPTFRIGGEASGVAGVGLLVRCSAAGAGVELPISAAGRFVCPVTATSGASYSVTIARDPSRPWQTCSVVNGTGTVSQADVTDVLVSCSTRSFAVGGRVSGLAGAGLVLHSRAGDDVTVAGDGPFAFPTRVASGATYEVTVKATPASPSQRCDVANASGVVADADVADVTVTCTTTHRIVVNVSSLDGTGLVLRNNGADDLAVAGDGPAAFATPLPSGSAYAVTVLEQPRVPAQTCVVSDGAGTVGDADVTGVQVSCTTNRYTVGGTVTGLGESTGLVLQNNGSDDLALDEDGAFTFRDPVASGAAYTVTVKASPPLRLCSVSRGAGTVGDADVTGVDVRCTPEVLQRWDAPTTWGARWPDSPTMVQHAYFDGTRIVEEKGISWAVAGATPPQQLLRAFPSGPRWSAGPFDGARYQATGDSDAVVDLLNRDLLVCAVVAPDYNPSVPDGDGLEAAIVAKGLQEQPPGVPSQVGAGWVLMQMHDMFCFHYQYLDRGVSRMAMAYTPTFFADRNQRATGPLNPSYVVVCGGRSGDTIVAAANGYPAHYALFTDTVAGELDRGPVPHPLTIGGYDTGDASHFFGGRVFETAVWAEPATPANIEAKMNAVLGLPPGARYTRNREGPWAFAGGQLDGGVHTAWRNAPRIDPARGLLFGLQGWNRLTYPEPSLNDVSDVTIGQRNPVVATGEDLSGEATPGVVLWTRSAGASIARDVQARPPGDSRQAWADHVVLGPGTSVSRALQAFEAAGPVHAMLWVRQGAASGSLTVRTTRPDPSRGASQAVVDLRALQPGWNRVWLTGLTTDGSATPGTLYLQNDGTTPIDFYAWGVDLTQIGGGGDLGAFDPGVEMYDWGAGDALGMSGYGRYPVDVLELPPVPVSTAADGFCLSVDAQPPPGLPWNAPFARNRALASWVGDGVARTVHLFMEGTGVRGAAARRLCFTVGGGATACADPTAPPLSWGAGSKHTVAGCASASGAVRLYLDGVLAASAAGAAPPDLALGHVLVGNGATPETASGSVPWHGYVAKALVCRDLGGVPSGCR